MQISRWKLHLLSPGCDS